MLVHIVADYGAGDLAFAEVVQRIKLHLPDAEPLLVWSPHFALWQLASVSLNWVFIPHHRAS